MLGGSVWWSVGVTVSTTLTPPISLCIKAFSAIGWGVRVHVTLRVTLFSKGSLASAPYTLGFSEKM